MVVSASLFNST